MNNATFLDRLGELPDPSPALRLYLARLADFLAVNAAGTYAPAEAWGKANDDKAEAWAALSY